ncbi:hypothetical protein J3A83DRAFT_1149563 [Scleroderma citrinum]
MNYNYKRSNILADDIAFVDLSADELPLRESSRVSVIYCAIRKATDHWCPLGYDFMCPKLRELWIQMIEGDNSTDDVWLWVDGDEEYIRKGQLSLFVRDISESDWVDAQSALRRRITPSRHSSNKTGNYSYWYKTRNKRIRNTTPKQRFATIVWITFNSNAVRDLTIQLGRTPKVVPYDFVVDIENITRGSWKAFPQVSGAWEEAVTRLQVDGCTCTQGGRWMEPDLRSWFNMLTWLDGRPPIIEAIGHHSCTRCQSWREAAYDRYQCNTKGTRPNVPLWDSLCWSVICSESFVYMDYRIRLSTATILSRMVGPGVRQQLEQQLRSQVIINEAEVEYALHVNSNYPRELRRAVAELSCGLPSCSKDLMRSLLADIPDAVLDETPLGIKLGMIPWNSGDKHDRWWHYGFGNYFSYNSKIFREFPLPTLSSEGLAFRDELQSDDWQSEGTEWQPALTTFVAVAMFLRKKGVLLRCCRRCQILYAQFFSDKLLSASLSIQDSPGCDVSSQSSFDTEDGVTGDDETFSLVSQAQPPYSTNYPGTQEPSGMETFTNLLHNPSHSLDDMELKLTEEFSKLVQYAKSLHPRLDLSACFRLPFHDHVGHVEERATLPALPVITSRAQNARSSKLTKSRKINVIKQKLIDMLKGVEYFVVNDCLPWSTLEGNLAKHGFEFVNWPEEVTRENGNRGIRDLSAEHADKLYNAIVHPDAQRRLYLRSLELSSEPVEDAVGVDDCNSNVTSGSKRMLDSGQHSGQQSKRIKFRPTVTPMTYSGSQL